MDPDAGVSIADPSWGNLHLLQPAFLRMFSPTPDSERGRVLIIGSGPTGSGSVDAYRPPARQLQILPAGLRQLP
jgi:hypothetical protein